MYTKKDLAYKKSFSRVINSSSYVPQSVVLNLYSFAESPLLLFSSNPEISGKNGSHLSLVSQFE